MAEPKKASRTKVVGDFGEYFVSYLLHKKGYSTAVVNQVGIDVLA